MPIGLALVSDEDEQKLFETSWQLALGNRLHALRLGLEAIVEVKAAWPVTYSMRCGSIMRQLTASAGLWQKQALALAR